MPSAVMLARFRRSYPAALWRDASYGTRTGVIPFSLFWIYYLALAPLHAFDRVQTTFATASAIAVSFPKESGALPESLRNDLCAAFLAAEE